MPIGLLVDSLSAARKLPRDSLVHLIDAGPYSAEAALAAGLVDTLLHEMDLDSLAARAVSRKPVEALSLTKYLSREESPETLTLSLLVLILLIVALD